jgi:hypothetical protein
MAVSSSSKLVNGPIVRLRGNLDDVNSGTHIGSVLISPPYNAALFRKKFVFHSDGRAL